MFFLTLVPFFTVREVGWLLENASSGELVVPHRDA